MQFLEGAQPSTDGYHIIVQENEFSLKINWDSGLFLFNLNTRGGGVLLYKLDPFYYFHRWPQDVYICMDICIHGHPYGDGGVCNYKHISIQLIEEVEHHNMVLAHRERVWQHQLRVYIENGWKAHCYRKDCQEAFKEDTDSTTRFTDVFEKKGPFEMQAGQFQRCLKQSIQKCFRKLELGQVKKRLRVGLFWIRKVNSRYSC